MLVSARRIKIQRPGAEPVRPPEVVIDNPLQFLRDTGLLFFLNQNTFHPLGLALSVEQPKEGRVSLKLEDGTQVALSARDILRVIAICVRLLDYRTSPYVAFSRAEFEGGSQKMQQYLKVIGNQTMQKRHDGLGYVIQKKDDVE